jgi:hypothetical protein
MESYVADVFGNLHIFILGSNWTRKILMRKYFQKICYLISSFKKYLQKQIHDFSSLAKLFLPHIITEEMHEFLQDALYYNKFSGSQPFSQ